MLVAGIVLVAGMLVIGTWVTSQIEEGVKENAGAVTALYVDALIAPITQNLAASGRLDAESAHHLDLILQRGALRNEISAFKLWTPDGRVVYSDHPDLVGHGFEASPGLGEALDGRVHTGFGKGASVEGGRDAGSLLEIYSPVRSADTGAVIAVAEFYTATDSLDEHLLLARLRSWLVVGAVSLAMFAALSFLFVRGSRTIRGQRRVLDEKIAELSQMLEWNRSLGQRVDQANHQIADLNERNLRRISAELHDGPVQLLSFAALRLDKAEDGRQDDIRQAIAEAMKEIRYICNGLALPELQGWSVPTIARRLVATHESRTGQTVSLQLAPDLPEIALAARICVYRFIQEALNNGAKHAGGAGQSLSIGMEGNMITVEVTDKGPGFDPGATREGLGLAGLRERVATLKGQFQLRTQMGGGTSVAMRLPAMAEGSIA